MNPTTNIASLCLYVVQAEIFQSINGGTVMSQYPFFPFLSIRRCRWLLMSQISVSTPQYKAMIRACS